MKNKTLTWILIVIGLLIVLLIVGKKAGWFGKNGNFKEVEVAKIEPIDIVETVAATGKIQPEIEVMLSSEVSGEIIELPIKEGEQVEKGDLLVRINPDLIQSALSQAQAGLQNARAQLAQAQASLKMPNSTSTETKRFLKKGSFPKVSGIVSKPIMKWPKPTKNRRIITFRAPLPTLSKHKTILAGLQSMLQ